MSVIIQQYRIQDSILKPLQRCDIANNKTKCNKYFHSTIYECNYFKQKGESL